MKPRRESRTLTPAILDSTIDMIWSVDPADFRLLTFNRSLRDYFLQHRGIRLKRGMRQEDLFTDQKYLDLWRGLYKRVLAEGSFTTEYTVSADTHTLQLTFNLLERKGKVFGISVFGRDITARKRAELLQQEYGQVVESTQELIAVIDRNYRYTLANRAYLQYHGLKREDVMGASLPKLFGEEFFATVMKANLDECFRGKRVHFKARYRYPRLGERDLQVSYFPIKGEGRAEKIAFVLKDITERKRAAQELRRLNRALRTISECDKALVRAREESDLLHQICEILVRMGGYRMAWVGFAEDDEDKSVRPVAQAGFEDGYLQTANITWADTERGRGPTGVAIRTGKTAVARDMLADPSLAPWREEARKRGYASSITLPLFLDDKVLGALAVYAEDADAFDSAEVALLTELADELVYGIQALRTRAEHQRMEEAMLHSEEFLRRVIDTTPALIHSGQPDGGLDFFNQRWLDYVGLSLDELLGWKWTASIHPQDVAAMVEKWRASISSGEPFEYEARVRRADGEYRWMFHRKVPLRDMQGRIVKWYGSSLDIEDRKRADEALHHEKAFTESILESLPDSFFILDSAGRYVRWNRNAGKALGYSAEEFAALDPLAHVAEEDRPLAARKMQEALTKGSSTADFHLLAKDGRKVPYLLTATRAVIDDKSYLIGIGVDITERHEMEEALALLKHSIDIHYDGAYWTDSENRFIYINDAGCKSLGYEREELIGKTILDVNPHASPQDLDRVWETLRRQGFFTTESVHRRKDGSEFPVEIASTYVQFGGKEFNCGFARDITERKRTEEALIEEKHLLLTLMDNLPDKIYFKDRESRFTRINAAMAADFGLSDAAEVIGKTDFKFYLAGHAGEAFEDEQEIIRTGKPLVGKEEKEVWSDGQVSWASTTKMPLRDANGNIIGTFGVSRDITNHKRAEEALSASEERFRGLVENATVGIYRTTPEGRILMANAALVTMLGYESLEALAARNLETEGFEPSYPRAVFRQRVEQDGEVRGLEEEWKKRDGSVIYVRESARAVRSPEGKVLYYDGVVEDITAEKRAEAEHVRLVTAIEQSAEAVVITDPAGEIEYVNPAFTRITGYSREEALGRNPRILKSGKHEPEFYQQLWETILKGEPWYGELINQRKDGRLYTEQMTITPVQDEYGKVTHFIASKQDVTERKTLEAQLQQASKMEAVGRLAGGVAHDFNNLLTVINGYSEILLERHASDTSLSSYLDEIHKAGERAASLTRQLLAFSRQQVLTPQVLDLNAIVSNLEKMLRRLIGEDVKLHTILNPAVGRVKADPGQIEQVIMNLAVNARDAMPKGGSLTFETSNVELDEEYTRNHPTVKPGPHVMLGVSDTGEGMTPETQARLFEPFFTTKEHGKGTGLGLATVYGIVKQSGGSIWVYSEVGRGTTFKIYFPVVSDDAAARAPSELETDSAGGTETVLVVEDEEGVRSLVRLALAAGGYNVLESKDAKSALAVCASHDGPIDLLLTDVVMPQMSGPDVASKVAALRPGIRVLYMSGYTDDSVVHHGVLSHDMPFIQKPFSPAALRKKIREVLGGK